MNGWSSPDPVIARHLERARQERAEAVAGMARAAAKAAGRISVGLGGAVLGYLRAAGTNAMRRRRERAAIRELRSLDDRLLKDIGLRRSDIQRVAMELVAGQAGGADGERRQSHPVALVGDDDGYAALSHDLRTPLTSIRSFSKILRDNPDLPRVTRQHYLGVVIAESERLGETIDTLLNPPRAA